MAVLELWPCDSNNSCCLEKAPQIARPRVTTSCVPRLAARAIFHMLLSAISAIVKSKCKKGPTHTHTHTHAMRASSPKAINTGCGNA